MNLLTKICNHFRTKLMKIYYDLEATSELEIDENNKDANNYKCMDCKKNIDVLIETLNISLDFKKILCRECIIDKSKLLTNFIDTLFYSFIKCVPSKEDLQKDAKTNLDQYGFRH